MTKNSENICLTLKAFYFIKEGLGDFKKNTHQNEKHLPPS